jgi:hypothetical protein
MQIFPVRGGLGKYLFERIVDLVIGVIRLDQNRARSRTLVSTEISNQEFTDHLSEF